MKQCIKMYYSLFIWSSTCFGRHTAHHQESKTALAASGFSYVEGCWTCSWWTLSGTVYCAWQRPPATRPTNFHVYCAWQRPPATRPTNFRVYCAWQRPPATRPTNFHVYCAWQRPPATRPTTFHVWKPRGCQCSFRLLMIGGVSPETCWALYKYGIINFGSLLHLVGFFNELYRWLVIVNTVPMCFWRVFGRFTVRISAETLSALTKVFVIILKENVRIIYYDRPLFAGFSICYSLSFVFRIHVVWVTQDFFRSAYRMKVLVAKTADKRIYGKSKRRRELSSSSSSPSPPHSLSYHRSTISSKASSPESAF